MDYVIKGRGENRGKYLCWARMAPNAKPTKDGFVWLLEQRKAARWKGPRYRSTWYWAEERARVHDGYFVKLVAPKAVTANVQELRNFIIERAAGAKDDPPCHWFSADFHDAGDNFCWQCAKTLVDEKYTKDPKRFEELYGVCDNAEERYCAAIDGGWVTEYDSPPYCETCGQKLSGDLTEYGADQEIEALTTYASPGFDDCDEWAALSDAIAHIPNEDPRWRKIAKVIKRSARAETERRGRC